MSPVDSPCNCFGAARIWGSIGCAVVNGGWVVCGLWNVNATRRREDYDRVGLGVALNLTGVVVVTSLVLNALGFWAPLLLPYLVPLIWCLFCSSYYILRLLTVEAATPERAL